MIMNANNTCVPGNSTHCLRPSSPAGLAVGLTLFFLLLVIIVGVVIYKYISKIRNTMRLGSRRTQEKEDRTNTPQPEPHQYASPVKEHSTEQTPIYENVASHSSGYNRPTAKQSRLPREPEEDLYLQCDTVNDGIYTNDPVRNSIVSDPQEEEVYIVPDSV